jgi:signal transduction histidine kinase
MIRNFWKEAKGIGIASFRFRLFTYACASAIMVLHHVENGLPLAALEYFSIVVFMISPHVFFYRYVKSGNRLGQVIRDTTYDFFFAGWLMGILNLSIVPSFIFGLGALTNYLSGRGFVKLYRVLLMPLACFIILLIEGFDIHFETPIIMTIVSLLYCVVHYIASAALMYSVSSTARQLNEEINKQQQEILAQAEELKALNESLRDLNISLEEKVHERTNELEMKNKKLEEYTFVNAHKLRAPVATILGLIHLFDYKDSIEIETIIKELKKTSLELDKAIKEIQIILENEGRKFV